MYMVDLSTKQTTKFGRSSSAVLHIDWSEDGDALRTTDSSYEYLFYDSNSLQQNTRGATSYRDTAWMTQSCTLGWGVQGIFSGSQDGSDINCAAFTRNPVLGLDYQLLATGDDDGMINVFRYPCCVEESGKVQGRGHSSHVTNVQWSEDGEYLYSLGGNDTALIKWKVNKK